MVICVDFSSQLCLLAICMKTRAAIYAISTHRKKSTLAEVEALYFLDGITRCE